MGRDSAPSRIAVLLGAGASVDAGLPTTVTFAKQLLEAIAIAHRRHPSLVDTLNFVYGAMVNHRTERGGSPFDAVNVETMISAIRLLRDRGTHEVAPFIRDWKPEVNRGRSSSRSRYGAALVEAVRSDQSAFMASGDVEDAVNGMIADAVGDTENGPLYEELEEAIRTQVRRILRETVSVDYLAPLVQLAVTQPGGLDVATLNYDLTVEDCAAHSGVSVDRGGDHLPLGLPVTFESAAPLRLLKIHGSIDLHIDGSSGSRLRKPKLVRDTSRIKDFAPAIVIGDRDKLGSGGRTISLLVAFAQALEAANRLVVVGYAFADAHVNDLIVEWLDGDAARTITVLDPSWPRPDRAWSDVRAALTSELSRANRIHVIRDTAAGGLQRALTEEQPADPNPRLHSTVQWSETTAEITFTNTGEELTSFSASLGYDYPRPTALALVRADAREASSLPGTWSIPVLAPGDSVSVIITFETREPKMRFSIRAQGSARDWAFTVTLEEAGMSLTPQS